MIFTLNIILTISKADFPIITTEQIIANDFQLSVKKIMFKVEHIKLLLIEEYYYASSLQLTNLCWFY